MLPVTLPLLLLHSVSAFSPSSFSRSPLVEEACRLSTLAVVLPVHPLLYFSISSYWQQAILTCLIWNLVLMCGFCMDACHTDRKTAQRSLTFQLSLQTSLLTSMSASVAPSQCTSLHYRLHCKAAQCKPIWCHEVHCMASLREQHAWTVVLTFWRHRACCQQVPASLSFWLWPVAHHINGSCPKYTTCVQLSVIDFTQHRSLSTITACSLLTVSCNPPGKHYPQLHGCKVWCCL